MPDRQHRYQTRVVWTGNTGSGTSGYRAYSRDHDITAGDKPPIAGSADKAFRGDAARWSPEDLLLASLSTCHQLWYLHLCADAGVTVTAYEDTAIGIMVEEADGAGQFTSVTLHPAVALAQGADADLARGLHHDAHAKCFIARSVNFPVTCEPRITLASA
jgi:organic hydroperoxide reductase OsmC/OhrA